MAQPNTNALQAVLDYTFARQQLLLQALTHSSLARERIAERSLEEHKRKANTDRGKAARPEASPNAFEKDNEQLEFLGDAVLGMVVADILFRRFPDLHEGEWTRLRANLVSRRHMAQVAASLNLGQHLRLGKGEERSGGRKKVALLANCIEAILAAMYLDGGLPPVKEFVDRRIVAPYIEDLREALDLGGSIGDHKSALQELLQARKKGRPDYVLRAESGPDHRKRFLVEVRLPSEEGQPGHLARGLGTTKKRAEQEAARRAVRKLRKQESSGIAVALSHGGGA